MILKGKSLVVKFFDLFGNGFKPVSNRVYTAECKCGWKGDFKSSKGYTNLQNHIESAHKDYIDSDVSSEQQILTSFMYTSKVKTYWGWLDWVIGDLHPFSYVERQRNYTHGGLPRMSLDTFMIVMTKLTKAVECKISNMLPNKFALIFDGWSQNSRHYVAIFASFPSTSNSHGYETVLLSFAPLTGERNLSSDAHIRYFGFVLELYGKGWTNVTAIIGDNCNTNTCMAKLVGTHFIGCASHRFNLAMKLFIERSNIVFDKINSIMQKLQNHNLSIGLQEFTHLKPKPRNITRWSSTFNMIKRYTRIREFLRNLGDEDFESMLLTPREDRQIDAKLIEMTELEFITLQLQKDETSLALVRALFDKAILKYPYFASKISSYSILIRRIFSRLRPSIRGCHCQNSTKSRRKHGR